MWIPLKRAPLITVGPVSHQNPFPSWLSQLFICPCLSHLEKNNTQEISVAHDSPSPTEWSREHIPSFPTCVNLLYWFLVDNCSLSYPHTHLSTKDKQCESTHRMVNKLLEIFMFQQDSLKKTLGNVTFVGHMPIFHSDTGLPYNFIVSSTGRNLCICCLKGPAICFFCWFCGTLVRKWRCIDLVIENLDYSWKRWFWKVLFFFIA